MKKIFSIKWTAYLSLIFCSSFFVTTESFSQPTVSRVEYYIDADPGYGNATSLPVAPGIDIADLTISINPIQLTQGIHKLYVRAKDANGNWSLTNEWLFYKPYGVTPTLTPPSNIVLLEYYIDTDPGIGNGKPVSINAGTDLSNLVIPIKPETLSPCSHTLYIRSKDANGSWSLINSWAFNNTFLDVTAKPLDFMVQFDGQNDYLDLGTWFNKQKFTLSFWVKPDSLQANGATIAAIQNDLYFYSNPQTRNNYILSHLLQNDLLPNQWNHVTITVDGTTNTRKVYLFGQLIDTNVWTYAPQNGFNFRFGNDGFFSSSYFKGSLDEIKLWDHVLSADSIYSNVSKSLNGNETGLLGYWNFNNGCDATAPDLTVNNHTAVLMNGLAKAPSTVPNIGQQVIPNKGGNTNIITVKIYDNLYKQGATAKLTSTIYPVINADTTVISNDSSMAVCTFNLAGSNIGLYNVVLTNPDSTKKTYPNSFTIEQGKPLDLWVDIIGRNAVRNGRPFTFQVAYGNNSNVDAKGVPIWITFPYDAIVEPKFNFIPNTEADSIRLDSVGKIFYLDTVVNGIIMKEQYMALYFQRIPAGFSGHLNFSLKYSGVINGFHIGVEIGKNFYNSPLDSNMIKCLINGIIPAALNFIPGFSCGTEVLNTFFKPIANLAFLGYDAFIDDIKPLNYAVGIGKVLLECSPAGSTWRYVRAIMNLTKVGKNLKKLSQFSDLFSNECVQSLMKITNSISDSILVVNSFDPNEKAGPSVYQKTNSPFSYTIAFENKQSATAAAQEVTVIDTLDKSKFDISSFSFGTFGFGDTSSASTFQYQKSFTKNIDLRPAKNLIVKAQGRVDTALGIAYWKFTSLDPSTMLLTEDPFLGFLPPNITSPKGEGWVSYNINPYPYLETGTPIKNKATITFDYNSPINTNEYTNTIDKILPHSHIIPLSPVQSDSNFVVKWRGIDSISGVRQYDIYVSTDSADFIVWKNNYIDTSAIYSGHLNHQYSFYSIATDSAGNVETPKTLSEATTGIHVILPLRLLDFTSILINRETVRLNWKTTNEINTSLFEVEHSLNGTSFSKIGSVSAVNNPSTENLYAFVHNLTEHGTHYYRLKMIDIDGRFSYSKILKLWVSKNSSELFAISPNPANSTINVVSEDISAISIHDLLGKLLFTKNMRHASSAIIDVSVLSKGIYAITVQSKDGRKQTKKLVID